jgi:anti-sigma factor RsiW
MRITLFNRRRDGVTEEQLSAYVDGWLDAAPRARIEDWLERSAELRARLEALRATVRVLRSAERMRAPRSFALTPAMAYGPGKPIRSPGLTRISPLVPAMAAAAAALALGLLLVGNVTGSLRQSGGGAFEERAATGMKGPSGPAAPAGTRGVAGEAGTAGTPAAERLEAAAVTTAVVTTRVVEKPVEATVPAQATAPPGAAMPSGAATPAATSLGAVTSAATVVVEKEAFKAAQATSGTESAPPMLAADLVRVTPTPAAGAVAPAGPQSAAAPAMTPVETPIAAERAADATEGGQTAPVAPEESRQAEVDEVGAVAAEGAADAEAGLGLPLWQLEAGFAALAAVLGAVAIAVAVQRRRSSRLP